MTAVAEPVQITAEDLYEYIAHHIRTYRKRWGWTQLDLANNIDRSVSSVTAWETGKTKISLADLLAVADAFGQPMAAFLPRGAV